MKALKRVAIALAIYVGIVVAFEGLVGFMGMRQAGRGVQAGESWLVITTTDADGSAKDTVVAGVESAGQLYVSANHWPRAWYRRALQHAEVEVTRGGEKRSYLAVSVTGAERDRIAADYHLPLAIRFLTGFPPRAFLRLMPR